MTKRGAARAELDGLRSGVVISQDLAENLIDEVRELIEIDKPCAGYERYDCRIAAREKEVAELQDAIKRKETGE